MIHHYTNLHSLALILKSGKLRLTRLDCFDDVGEAQTHAGVNFGRQFFASCWSSAQEEQIPQWAMYGDAMRGVRITPKDDPFVRHRLNAEVKHKGRGVKFDDIPAPYTLEEALRPGRILVPDGEMVTTFGGPVEYLDDVSDAYRSSIQHRDGGGIIIPGSAHRLARFKSARWRFQAEHRFVLMACSGPDALYSASPSDYAVALAEHLSHRSMIDEMDLLVRYVDIRLAREALNGATITLGPLAPAGSREIVDSLASALAPGARVLESELSGSVRAK